MVILFQIYVLKKKFYVFTFKNFETFMIIYGLVFKLNFRNSFLNQQRILS